MNLQDRVNQYKIDGKNLFSTTEAIAVALLNPELYQALMPKLYKQNPMGAYFSLDVRQRTLVEEAYQEPNHIVVSNDRDAGEVR